MGFRQAKSFGTDVQGSSGFCFDGTEACCLSRLTVEMCDWLILHTNSWTGPNRTVSIFMDWMICCHNVVSMKHATEEKKDNG